MKLSWISSLKHLFSKNQDPSTQRKENIISSIIRTNAFSKLTVQDKVLSLGKLITIFRSDCGFTPASLERTLVSLQKELQRQTNATWDALYSNPGSKSGDKKK